jgi:hypothetical protein
MVLCFQPKGPARSQIIQSQHKTQVKVMRNSYRWPIIFQPFGIYRSLYLCLVMANIIANTSKVIKGRSEGIHNATTIPINSYQPNAQFTLT